MARRRNTTLFDTLFQYLVVVPWWVGPMLAGLAYLSLHFAIPLLLGTGLRIEPKNNIVVPSVSLLQALSIGLAPWASAFVLLVWGCAGSKRLVDRARLSKQTGLESIRRLSWREFELLMCEAFRRQGYLIEHTGESGPDGGVDLVLRRNDEKTLVQCKQWRNESVGVKPVRELRGVVASDGAQHGIFVTSGTYTEAAKDFAWRNPLTLISGLQLAEMIQNVQSQCTAPTIFSPDPSMIEAEPHPRTP